MIKPQFSFFYHLTRNLAAIVNMYVCLLITQGNKSMRYALFVCVIGIFLRLQADDVYLRDGSVFRNTKVIDTVDTQVRCLTSFGMNVQLVPLALIDKIVYSYYDNRERTTFEDVTENKFTIRTVTGNSFLGKFVQATDSTVTYSTDSGSIVLLKSNILSVERFQHPNSSIVKKQPHETRNILIKEYDNLPLLIITVAGGAWAVSLFSDAKDYSDAADAFAILGLNKLAKEAHDKYDTKLLTGIGVSIVAVIFFVWAITPTEKYIEQPISIIPTSDGIRVAVHF